MLAASREDMACSSQTHPARSSDALVAVKSQRRARHLKNIFEEGSVEEPAIKLLLGCYKVERLAQYSEAQPPYL